MSDWVDPGAFVTLVGSVRDGFTAAPVWARVGLVVILAVVVILGVFRVASSVIGRIVLVAVIVLFGVGLWSLGSGLVQRLGD